MARVANNPLRVAKDDGIAFTRQVAHLTEPSQANIMAGDARRAITAERINLFMMRS
jgi:hypothetical protein